MRSMNAINNTNQYRPSTSNNAQFSGHGGVGERYHSRGSSSEASINDEELADEIADEDEHKSVGYSSGVSLY